MKKIRGILLIFLAIFAIFSIATGSFAKNHFRDMPWPWSDGKIEILRRDYVAKGGLASAPGTGSGPRGTPTLREAQKLHNEFHAKLRINFLITELKTEYLALGGTESEGIGTYNDPITGQSVQNKPTLSEPQALLIEILKSEYKAIKGNTTAGIGTYDDPSTLKVDKTPTLSEAGTLIAPFKSIRFAKLKTEYLARGGTESEGTASYQGGPTLSEAQSLLRDFSQKIKIAELKTEYLALGGLEGEGTGSYDNPDTPDVEGTPTLSEAEHLHMVLVTEIERIKTKYLALAGSDPGTGSYRGRPTLSQAQALVQQTLTQIANWRKLFGLGDQGTPIPGTGAGALRAPNLRQAQSIYDYILEEIPRLKTNYLALGGSESAGTGTYDDPETLNVVETTPTYQESVKLLESLTLSKARPLVQVLKKSESSQTLIIGLTLSIGGALLLCGGLGYGFYRRWQKR